jgi:hypothetical protein
MSGVIYLIWIREFINKDEHIYKLGRTENIVNRVKNYPKDSLLLCSIYCNNEKNMEKILLNKFSIEFKNRTDIGSEYFEGDYKKMIEYIYKFVLEEQNNPEYKLLIEKNMENKSKIKKKQDPTIILIEYINENLELLSNNICKSKELYENFMKWIDIKIYNINISHSKMLSDLINNFDITHKVHRFDSGVDKAIFFPNLINTEENKIESVNTEEINPQKGNITEFINEYIIKDEQNKYFKLKDIKEVFKNSVYFNGHITTLKEEIENHLKIKCIERIKVNKKDVYYIFKGYSIKNII